MIDKLSSIETTYEELMTLLASPAVQSNAAEYRKHSKALSEIQPLVERFREYKAVVKEAAQAEELAKGAATTTCASWPPRSCAGSNAGATRCWRR